MTLAWPERISLQELAANGWPLNPLRGGLNGERGDPFAGSPTPTFCRSGMNQRCDPSRASAGAVRATKAVNPTRRPPTPKGPVAAREWDVAHAAALRALLT